MVLLEFNIYAGRAWAKAWDNMSPERSTSSIAADSTINCTPWARRSKANWTRCWRCCAAAIEELAKDCKRSAFRPGSTIVPITAACSRPSRPRSRSGWGGS